MATTDNNPTSVPPEEIERRLWASRRLAYEHNAMPHILYRGQFIVCPWPACGFRLAGIDFQLETYMDAQTNALYQKAWWLGDGFAGQCPGCGQYVLFSIKDKKAVSDPHAMGLLVLPDDWHSKAYVM